MINIGVFSQNNLDANRMELNEDKVKKSIYKKLIIKIVLFSSVVTVLLTLIQLYSDYLSDIQRIESVQHDVLSSYAEPLQLALWSLNFPLIENQIKGISKISNINSIRIITSNGKIWQKGEHKQNYVVEKTIELKHNYSANNELLLGSVIIQSDLVIVYQRLLKKALFILLSNGIKTFLVAVFIVFLVRSMITNPLASISKYIKKYNPLEKRSLTLNKGHDSKSADYDEIDQVIESINVMNLEVHNSYGEINKLTKVLENTVCERTKELESLLEISLTDALTGVANRRKFDEELASEWRRAKRDGTDLSLILLDIDEFKAYNDNYGHPSGDDVLCSLSAAMNSHALRATDHFCRYGGEEFVLLTANSSSGEALLMAEKLRDCVERLALPHNYSSTSSVVTISLGLATFTPAEGGNCIDLLKAADVALYTAKNDGRNRVKLFQR